MAFGALPKRIALAKRLATHLRNASLDAPVSHQMRQDPAHR
jgi:hypothetical protein